MPRFFVRYQTNQPVSITLSQIQEFADGEPPIVADLIQGIQPSLLYKSTLLLANLLLYSCLPCPWYSRLWKLLSQEIRWYCT